MKHVVVARARGFAASWALSLAASLLLAAPAGAAGKPHCRDLTFDGAAGAGSQDKVSLRVVDALGNVIEESCKIQVKPNETHTEFARRLPGAWGDGAGLLCGDDSGVLKNTCSNGLGRSCRHRFIFKQKRDGTIKREVLRICCFESADCRGPRLGRTQPTWVPISIQTKVDPDLVFQPAVPPVVGITITPVALDPIGMTQRPFGELQTCRGEIGKAAKFVVPLLRSMLLCENDVLSGRLAEGTDCTAGDDVRLLKAIAELDGRLAVATEEKCAASGQPADFGYADCPDPCSGTPIDSWSAVAACAMCVAQDATATAVLDKYGDPGPAAGLAPSLQRCQRAVGSALLHLVQAHLSEIILCQRQIDSAVQSLPEGVTHCKFADRSGRRASAEAAVAAMLAANCGDDDVAGLQSCGADVEDETACVIDNATTLAGSIADAIFPEGQGLEP